MVSTATERASKKETNRFCFNIFSLNDQKPPACQKRKTEKKQGDYFH
jgi:hypothetical protein